MKAEGQMDKGQQLEPEGIHGILQARILDPGLPHCRQILYQLSHKGGPRILEWVAIPSPGDLLDLGLSKEHHAQFNRI